jgi:hypothetical protein
MAIRKRKKRRKTVVYKTLHRKLKIVQTASVRTAGGMFCQEFLLH